MAIIGNRCRALIRSYRPLAPDVGKAIAVPALAAVGLVQSETISKKSPRGKRWLLERLPGYQVVSAVSVLEAGGRLVPRTTHRSEPPQDRSISEFPATASG